MQVTIGNATLYLGDAREIVPAIGPIDAIVTDPPYGLKEARGKNKSRSNLAPARDYGVADWDDQPCPPEMIAVMRASSRWQIIFGGNYFAVPPSSCWLVWDKRNGANDFADCELAWTNLKKAVRRIEWTWSGFCRKGSDPRGLHPTQKPVGVMKWCIGHLPPNVTTICDPFMGSGTTGIAAIEAGKRFIGIERERRYFDTACERIAAAQEMAEAA
jgi:site-specific DNA-methyltransferase (adenine-specific)/modification methylase